MSCLTWFLIPSSEMHGIFTHPCVHHIHVCIALEFVLWVVWGRLPSNLFSVWINSLLLSTIFVAQMPFRVTVAIYAAFSCMWYVPKLSVLSRSIYFVLLPRASVTKHLQQVLPADKANLRFCFSQASHCPQPYSWLYYRIIWSSFLKNLLQLCLDVY